MLHDYLAAENFAGAHADRGAASMQRYAREAFEAILLDLMLPATDASSISTRLLIREGLD